MRWPSPWSEGFPGWHCECTAMGRKYLGARFDIHGGGMDLLFPHHECEIAQANASQGTDMVKYWMHNNMVTIDGQKMGKSLGNAISLEQFFTGNHDLLEKAYSPMTIRFFILQSHYRNPADFGNASLQASEKALARLFDARNGLEKLAPSSESTVNISEIRDKCAAAMNDDLNTPILISHLFEAAHIINAVKDGKERVDDSGIKELQSIFNIYLYNILGIKEDVAATGANTSDAYIQAVNLLLDIRLQAKADKNWTLADKIRNELASIGFDIKDTKDGVEWKLSQR
jgi:cysteinyl-tRNA synthetase